MCDHDDQWRLLSEDVLVSTNWVKNQYSRSDKHLGDFELFPSKDLDHEKLER